MKLTKEQIEQKLQEIWSSEEWIKVCELTDKQQEHEKNSTEKK